MTAFLLCDADADEDLNRWFYFLQVVVSMKAISYDTQVVENLSRMPVEE
jgi:hypothetical protein